MSVALLDVSVLIALFDRDHVRSGQVGDWFSENAPNGWASCAVTENGFVRIVSQPSYPNPIGVTSAIGILANATAHRFHKFWHCDVSITQHNLVSPKPTLRSSQITDAYLLGLAVRYQGRFVTLDQRIDPDIVIGATTDHLVVL